jgi:hypothetical protein
MSDQAAAIERLAAAVEDHNRLEKAARQDTPEIRAETEALRRPLHKLSLVMYLRAGRLLPQLAQARAIPESYWTVDEDGLTITCPCEERVFCDRESAAMCACGRGYVAIGDEVRVLFSPVPSA